MPSALDELIGLSAFYSLGRISHVGSFPKLEDQMCQTTAAGYEGEGSPDRCDALVWAFTELFPKMIEKAPDLAKINPLRGRRGGTTYSWMGGGDADPSFRSGISVNIERSLATGDERWHTSPTNCRRIRRR